MSPALRRAAALAALLTLMGCGTSVLDPTLDPYTWQPEGVNEQNIAVEVARPSDLAAPTGDVATGGAENVAALNRWRTGAGQSLGNGGAAASAGGTSGVGGASAAGTGGDTGGLDTGSLAGAGTAGTSGSAGTP